MRRSYEPKWLHREDGALLGINLGADFCAEHEWGIKGLHRMFGMITDDPNVIGVARRLIYELPEKDIHFFDTKGKSGKTILAVVHFYDEKSEKDIIERLGEAKPYKPYRARGEDPKKPEIIPLGVAWDEKSFCIWATETGDRENLRQLHKAMMEKKMLIGFGVTNNPFERAGLTLVRAEFMTAEAKQDIYDKDADYIRLRKTAEDTGIYKLLEKAGKRFYALSPRWKDDTKTDVIFWLNPAEQQIHNYGWFGIEELKQWAKNDGPIMMSKKKETVGV